MSIVDRQAHDHGVPFTCPQSAQCLIDDDTRQPGRQLRRALKAGHAAMRGELRLL
jgi:hypothetical protein